MIPHLVYVIEEARYAFHWIAYHHEHPTYPIVELDEYAVALGVVRLDRDNLVAPTVVVPIVAGLEAG